MTDPQSTLSGERLTLTWHTARVCVAFERWRCDKELITAEVTITTSAPGVGPHLTSGRLNLTSIGTRQQWVKRLTELFTEPDWGTLLEQSCLLAIKQYRGGEPALRLTPALPGQGPSWRINPLVYEKLPTVIFGAGGTGKSYLCLWLALMVETGQSLGDTVRAVQGHVLYLDYESDSTDASQRLARLIAGNPAFTDCHPLYRRMTQPLATDLAALSATIAEEAIDVLIVDSLAMACGGKDLNDPSTAVSYFSALRQLPVTSISIAHVPKNTENPTIYGGVFFTNIARSCWEAVGKVEREQEHTVVNLGLFHRKHNQRPEHPIGLKFTHSHQDERTSVEATTISDNEAFLDSSPLAVQLKHYLKDGAKTASSLAILTGKPIATVSMALSRGETRGDFQAIGSGRGAEWVLPPD